MSAPVAFPDWCSSGTATLPISSKVASGFESGERPAAQFFNYLFQSAYQNFNYLLGLVRPAAWTWISPVTTGNQLIGPSITGATSIAVGGGNAIGLTGTGSSFWQSPIAPKVGDTISEIGAVIQVSASCNFVISIWGTTYSSGSPGYAVLASNTASAVSGQMNVLSISTSITVATVPTNTGIGGPYFIGVENTSSGVAATLYGVGFMSVWGSP